MASEVGEEIALEVEAVATAATQCFERVVEQVQIVEKLCGEMERDAAVCKSWNRFVAKGAEIAAASGDGGALGEEAGK